MRILLIGKYPPLQGGISSKTYWLYRALKKRGFEFKIVTIETEDYSLKGYDPNGSNTSVISLKKSPWHIPESELFSDRIFAKAMKTVEAFVPDAIETNYLWPFCMPAVMVANVLEKPLLIRHAGSDIQKFRSDIEFENIMKGYFERASAIVTNRTVQTFVENLCGNPKKVHCLRRYVPDPEAFSHQKTQKQIDILFVGKINYHWNLKGLNLLINIIKRQRLISLFVIGGRYKEQILELIEKGGTKVEINVRDFVSPDLMPSILNSCKYVWSWDETEDVKDFSNIIWEAFFCDTPCIVNTRVADRITDEEMPGFFHSLVCKTTSEEVMDFKFVSRPFESDRFWEEKIALYNAYIESNENVYRSVEASSR